MGCVPHKKTIISDSFKKNHNEKMLYYNYIPQIIQSKSSEEHFDLFYYYNILVNSNDSKFIHLKIEPLFKKYSKQLEELNINNLNDFYLVINNAKYCNFILENMNFSYRKCVDIVLNLVAVFNLIDINKRNI